MLSPVETVAANTVQEEHRELRSLIEIIRARFAHQPWSDPMISSLLDSLVVHLETHFENEEEDGFFWQAVEAKPHLATTIDSLVGEHQRLLHFAEELARRCRFGLRTTNNWLRLGDAYERFRQKILMHEAKEHDLLFEMHQHDIGSKD